MEAPGLEDSRYSLLTKLLLIPFLLLFLCFSFVLYVYHKLSGKPALNRRPETNSLRASSRKELPDNDAVPSSSTPETRRKIGSQ